MVKRTVGKARMAARNSVIGPARGEVAGSLVQAYGITTSLPDDFRPGLPPSGRAGAALTGCVRLHRHSRGRRTERTAGEPWHGHDAHRETAAGRNPPARKPPAGLPVRAGEREAGAGE